MGNVAHSSVIPETSPISEDNIENLDGNPGIESSQNDGNKDLNDDSENVESDVKVDENNVQDVDKIDQSEQEMDANTMSFIEVEKPEEMDDDDSNPVAIATSEATEVSKESEVTDVKLNQETVDQFLQQLSASQTKDKDPTQENSTSTVVPTADKKNEIGKILSYSKLFPTFFLLLGFKKYILLKN